MKILGIINSSEFVASISLEEIEKVMNLYYGKLDTKIVAGTEFNLGAGHDFRAEIQASCKAAKDAMERFERARQTLMAFSIMVSNLPPELQPDANGGEA